VTANAPDKQDGRSRRKAWVDGLPSSERVYRRLRQMILTGQLPPQTRMVELHFAEQFEVSRTPVREALKRLTAENLILNDPVRGLVVHDPEPYEVTDMYLVRDVLEALAARLAAQRITPDELRQLHMAHDSMREGVNTGHEDLVITANLSFHDAIYRSARNETLFRMARDLSDLVRRFSAEAFADPQRAADVVDEHAEILDALDRHDANAAAAASSRHMQRTSANLLQIHHKQSISQDTAPGADTALA
jgi:DNA-binding GntR family transcriptional regulator